MACQKVWEDAWKQRSTNWQSPIPTSFSCSYNIFFFGVEVTTTVALSAGREHHVTGRCGQLWKHMNQHTWTFTLVQTRVLFICIDTAIDWKIWCMNQAWVLPFPLQLSCVVMATSFFFYDVHAGWLPHIMPLQNQTVVLVKCLITTVSQQVLPKPILNWVGTDTWVNFISPPLNILHISMGRMSCNGNKLIPVCIPYLAK